MQLKSKVSAFMILQLLILSAGQATAGTLSSPPNFPNDCPNYTHRPKGVVNSLVNYCSATNGSTPPATPGEFRKSNLLGWVDFADRDSNPIGFLTSCRYVQGPTNGMSLLAMEGLGETQWDDVVNPTGLTPAPVATPPYTLNANNYRTVAESLSPLGYALASPDSYLLKWVLAEIEASGGNPANSPAAQQYLSDLQFLQEAFTRLEARCIQEPGSNFAAGFPAFCRWYNGPKIQIKDASGVSHPVTQSDQDPNLNRFILSTLLRTVSDLERLTDPSVTNGWTQVATLATQIVSQAKPILLMGTRAEIGAYQAALWKGGALNCKSPNAPANGPVSLCNDNTSATNYANMDLEYTVIMDYASLIFGNTDPSTSAGFSGESSRMMEFVAKELISAPDNFDGGIHYIDNGTESPLYHGLDLMLLTDHFELTGDGSGSSSIQNMVSAGLHYFGNTFTNNSQPEGWSDIYWKSQWHHPQAVGLLALLGAPSFFSPTETADVQSETHWRNFAEHLFWETMAVTFRPCDADNPSWHFYIGTRFDVEMLSAWKRYAQTRPWIGSLDPSQEPIEPGENLETQIMRWDTDIQGFHGRAPIPGTSPSPAPTDSAGNPLVWNFGFINGPGGFRSTFVGGAMTSADSNFRYPATLGDLFPASNFGPNIDPASGAIRGVEFEVMLTNTQPTSASLGISHGYWLSNYPNTSTMAWRREAPASNPSLYQNIESAMLQENYMIREPGAGQLAAPSVTTPFNVTQTWRIAGAGMIGLLNMNVTAPITGIQAVVSRVLMGPNDAVALGNNVFQSGPLAVKFYPLRGFAATDTSVAYMPGGVESGSDIGSHMGVQILHAISSGSLGNVADTNNFLYGVWIGPVARLSQAPTSITPLYMPGNTLVPAGWEATLPAQKGQASVTLTAVGNVASAPVSQPSPGPSHKATPELRTKIPANTVVLTALPASPVLWCNEGQKDVSTNLSLCSLDTRTRYLTVAPGVGALVEPAGYSPW
jgi:hypothetical protein